MNWLRWYVEIWQDDHTREVDPFRYGMGMALGYVIIPMLAGILIILLVNAIVRRRKS